MENPFKKALTTPESEKGAAKRDEEDFIQVSKGEISEFKFLTGALLSPEVQALAKAKLIDLLTMGNSVAIHDAFEIIDKFSIPESIYHDSEVQAAAVEGFTILMNSIDELFYKTSIKHGLDIIKIFSIPDEIKLPVIENTIKNLTKHIWKEGRVEEEKCNAISAIADAFSIPDEVKQAAIKWRVREAYINGYDEGAIVLAQKFSIPESYLQSSEVQAETKKRALYLLEEEKGFAADPLLAKKLLNKLSISAENQQAIAREALLKRLKQNQLYIARHIVGVFDIPKSFLQSPEIQSMVQTALIALNPDSDFPTSALEVFPIPSSFLQNPEVPDASKIRVISSTVSSLNHDDSANALKTLEIFSNTEVNQELAKKALIAKLNKNNFNMDDLNLIFRIMQAFSVPESYLQSPEVQAEVKKLIIKCSDSHLFKHLPDFINTFSIPESYLQSPEVQAEVKKMVVRQLNSALVDRYEHVQQLIQIFSLPEEFWQEEMKKEVIKMFKQGYLSYTLKLIKDFSIPESLLQNSEIQESVKNGARHMLKQEFNSSFTGTFTGERRSRQF